MTDLELIHTFEKYLQDKMNLQERGEFETMLKENSEIKNKFSEHKEFVHKLKAYGNRKKFIAIAEEAERKNDLETRKKRKFNIPFSYTAIAASITGIILLTVSFYFGYHSANKSENAYLQTSKKQKTIEAKLDAILRNIDSDKGINKGIIDQAELSGTGFLVSSKGYILTNYHLIKDADSVLVYNDKQIPLKAEVLSKDTKYDLALLKIKMEKASIKSEIPYAFRRNIAEPGEEVFTVGYPREDIVYGEGSVSSSSGFQGDSLAYQISIPVNPGNSGGPLLDNAGNITGIISGKQTMAEGTGFAVKANYIQMFLKKSFEKEGLKIPNRNRIGALNRKDKVKKLKPFVYHVKVFQ